MRENSHLSSALTHYVFHMRGKDHKRDRQYPILNEARKGYVGEGEVLGGGSVGDSNRLM